MRTPLRTINAEQLYSEKPINFWEINEKKDWAHTGPETKLRVGRGFIRRYCATAKSVGNFGWALAQNLYSMEEMADSNYNGNGNKCALSPRRRCAIEECIAENYGNEPNNFKLVRNAITTGIRGIRYRERNPVPNQPTSKRRLVLSGNVPTILPSGNSKVVQPATGPFVVYR